MNCDLIYEFNHKIIQLIRGDITKISADAIVNAANERLRGGGGVDGAIHRAGGPQILEECKNFSGCPTGQAVVTTAGKLPAKFIIHTVGPIYRGGKYNEPELLRNAYLNSLLKVEEKKLEVIAFPSISTGIYGYPIESASEIALSTIFQFLKEHEYPKKVICVLFMDYDFEIYKKNLHKLKT